MQHVPTWIVRSGFIKSNKFKDRRQERILIENRLLTRLALGAIVSEGEATQEGHG